MNFMITMSLADIAFISFFALLALAYVCAKLYDCARKIRGAK